MKTLLTLAAALSMAIPTGAAMAAGGSYTGSWQVQLTHDVYVTNQGYTGHGPNTTHCIALTDDGSIGWTHSGYAELDGNANSSGQFAVIGNTIMIYIDASGGEGEIASIVFSTTARDGAIGKHGAYDYMAGGESYDADKATFGTKGSC
jgi:hypothetical protein